MMEVRSGPSKHHKTLCWIARLVPLVPVVCAPLLVLNWELPGYRTEMPLINGIVCFCLLVLLPAVIAWQWHIVGSILILIPSGAYIYHLCFPTHPLGPAFPLHYVLPLWAAFFTGGILHLIVGWRERSHDLPPENRSRQNTRVWSEEKGTPATPI